MSGLPIPLHRDDLTAILQGAAEAYADQWATNQPTDRAMFVSQADVVLRELRRLGVGVPDPVSVAELVDRCHVGRTAIDRWREGTSGFPEPRWWLAGRPVWEWTDVQAWGRATGRLRDSGVWDRPGRLVTGP